MKTAIIRILPVIYTLVFLTAALNAQEIPYDVSVPSFNDIAIAPGDRLTVLKKNNERIAGMFTGRTADSVYIEDKNETQHTVLIADILFVRTEFDKSRRALQYGLWGGAAGFMIGIPVGMHIVNRRGDDESASDAFLYIGSSVGSAIVGGLIGVGIGLAVLPGDKVYKIEHNQ